MDVNIKKLVPNAVIPTYAKEGDAGMDLTAVRHEFDEYGNIVYYIGLAMEIPEGYVGYIFPRSSVSKYGINLANSVGVIDSGYRGEIMCKFKPTLRFRYFYHGTGMDSEGVNTHMASFNKYYDLYDRVAQIIIMPLPTVTFKEVDELSTTDRGTGGFGSTNK